MLSARKTIALVFAAALAAFTVVPTFAGELPALAVERSLVGSWQCQTDYAPSQNSEAFVEFAELIFTNDGYFHGASLYWVGLDYFGLSYTGNYSYDDPSFTLTRQITDTDPKLVDDSGKPYEFQEEKFTLEFSETDQGEVYTTTGDGFEMYCLRKSYGQ